MLSKTAPNWILRHLPKVGSPEYYVQVREKQQCVL